MISEEDIQSVINLVTNQGLSEELVTQLRTQFEKYHFTYCIDDDMDAYTPAIERDGFNIYFVNSKDHCSTLTRDPASASGFVLSEVIADE